NFGRIRRPNLSRHQRETPERRSRTDQLVARGWRPAVISLIIPTLNEVDNVAPLLGRLSQSKPPLDEIIFVDDGSTDGTRERIHSLAGAAPVRLLERDDPSLGLAGAVIDGARIATGDWLVVMDADLSHPPEKIGELLRPLLHGRVDM